MPYDAGILYRDGHPMIVDGGDFPGALDRALEAADYEGFRRQQAEARAAGRYLGIGIAGYIEGTGVGPFETAEVRITASGKVVVSVALPSQGQGHETVLAQICAEALGIPLSAVRVLQGDTAAHPWGGGTIASRTAVVVGSAVMEAATAVRDHAARLASDRLEVAVEDLVFEDGRVHVAGSPSRGFSLGELAAAAAPGSGRTGAVDEVGLQAGRSFQPETVTFASGVHLAIVEVDIGTGAVAIRRYVVVHDCGRVINPLIVEGQIQGGIAQGVGGALFEELVYDESGQLLTGTMMDYGVPRVTDIPEVEMHHLETLSTRNPLGVKGVGEAGTIAVPAAVIGAVEDALTSFDADFTVCPLPPERVRSVVRSSIERRARSGDAPADAIAS
jgi:carbon-monoxide dehydrogenase large subunit